MAKLKTKVIPEIVEYTLAFNEDERLELLAALRYRELVIVANSLAISLIDDLLENSDG